MSISLPQMAANTATVTFPADEQGNTVTVVYYPGRVTESAISSIEAIETAGGTTALAAFSGFNEMLVSMIKSWDVYDDAAETVMFPLDAKRFRELPIPFRMAVFQAIIGHIRPESAAA